MNKKMMMIGIVLVLAVAWCMSAYAADAGTTTNASWEGFWNSVGGFFYNALPWNWGNWFGK